MDEKEQAEVEIIFKNRRVSASLSRTLKTDDQKFEFIKFSLGFEGDIGDGVDRSSAHDQIFKEMMGELVVREVAVKAEHDLAGIDEVVTILKNINKDIHMHFV